MKEFAIVTFGNLVKQIIGALNIGRLIVRYQGLVNKYMLLQPKPSILLFTALKFGGLPWKASQIMKSTAGMPYLIHSLLEPSRRSFSAGGQHFGSWLFTFPSTIFAARPNFRGFLKIVQSSAKSSFPQFHDRFSLSLNYLVVDQPAESIL